MQLLSSNTLLSKSNKPIMNEIKVLTFSKFRICLSVVGHLIQTWMERSCQRRELGQLSIDQLDDIGISKEDAMNEARKPFWEK